MRAILATSLLVLLALIPTSSAQGAPPSVDIKVYSSQLPLMPEVGLEQIKIQVAVICQAAHVATEPTTVKLGISQAPSYSTVILQPAFQSYQFQPNECLLSPGVHTFTFVGSITTTRDAPAYQDAVYELVARVDQPGVIQSGSAQAKAMFTVKNDYVPQVSVEAPTLFLEVPQYAEVEFPVEIINRGNGPTRTRIEIIQTGPDRLMMINAGPEVRTESQAGRGASAMYKASRTIQAMAGPDVGIQSFAARFVSTYDGAASGLVLTDETVLHFSVNVLPDPNATQPAAPAEHLDPEFASAPMAPLIGLLMLGVAAWRRRGL